MYWMTDCGDQSEEIVSNKLSSNSKLWQQNEKNCKKFVLSQTWVERRSEEFPLYLRIRFSFKFLAENDLSK